MIDSIIHIRCCLFTCNLDLFRIFTSSAKVLSLLIVISRLLFLFFCGWDIPLVSESSVQFVLLNTTDILLRHILGLVHVFVTCVVGHHLSDVLVSPVRCVVVGVSRRTRLFWRNLFS